jgi:AAA+ ATPase superfamily predicted ATPase
MRNLFEYGGVVSGEAFCNREKETGDLVRAMENGEKLFVFSERRYGKTSLVHASLEKLPKKGYVCADVHLWPRRSPSL